MHTYNFHLVCAGVCLLTADLCDLESSGNATSFNCIQTKILNLVHASVYLQFPDPETQSVPVYISADFRIPCTKEVVGKLPHPTAGKPVAFT